MIVKAVGRKEKLSIISQLYVEDAAVQFQAGPARRYLR